MIVHNTMLCLNEIETAHDRFAGLPEERVRTVCDTHVQRHRRAETHNRSRYPPRHARFESAAHVANRLQAALWREAIHLVAEGVASVEDVDKAVWAGPGLRWAAMGPHQLLHLGGRRRPERVLQSQHTLFTARYQSARGLKPQDPLFTEFTAQLTHKSNYRDCQALGNALRAASVEAIEFISAPSNQAGVNVALFHPSALRVTAPLQHTQWLCQTSADGVPFISQCQTRLLVSFEIGNFLMDGWLPQPT